MSARQADSPARVRELAQRVADRMGLEFDEVHEPLSAAVVELQSGAFERADAPVEVSDQVCDVDEGLGDLSEAERDQISVRLAELRRQVTELVDHLRASTTLFEGGDARLQDSEGACHVEQDQGDLSSLGVDRRLRALLDIRNKLVKLLDQDVERLTERAVGAHGDSSSLGDGEGADTRSPAHTVEGDGDTGSSSLDVSPADGVPTSERAGRDTDPAPTPAEVLAALHYGRVTPTPKHEDAADHVRLARERFQSRVQAMDPDEHLQLAQAEYLAAIYELLADRGERSA